MKAGPLRIKAAGTLGVLPALAAVTHQTPGCRGVNESVGRRRFHYSAPSHLENDPAGRLEWRRGPVLTLQLLRSPE